MNFFGFFYSLQIYVYFFFLVRLLAFFSTFVGNLKGILSMMKSTSPIYINVKGQLLDLAPSASNGYSECNS